MVCGFLAFHSLFVPLACRLSFDKKAAARLLPYPVILKIQSVDISLTLNMTM